MIKSTDNSFLINGKPLYIYSGEVHYFRVAPEKLDNIIQAARLAGINTLSTYIPWSWHEYEEGKFDFTGKTHPQRDLKSFIKKTRENGLYLIARIGPFSNAELKGEGIPLWLTDNYQEVASKGEGIVNLPHTLLISYINPTFRNFVKKWYGKVIPQIAGYQIDRGGNIILTQLCNEIGMIQWVNNCGDYSKEADKMYQTFLKSKYGSLSYLTDAYHGSGFKSFKSIRQPRARLKYGWQDFWDWAEFYRHYYADYFTYLYKLAKEYGITTPVIANIPQFIDFDVRGRGLASPMTTSFYRNFPDRIRNIVFGGAYQMRRLDYENFHDVCITTGVVKALTNYKNPVICAELQTGIMRDRPRLYASDVELNLKTSMAAGVEGVNCYMFSGGENPDNIGIFGKMHQWQAPVDPDGNTDDKFIKIKEHGSFLNCWNKVLSKTSLLHQTYVGIYPPYYGTEFLDNEDCSFLVYARDRYFFDGIGRLLNMKSTFFKVIDLIGSDLDPERVDHLWLFSLSFMDNNMQKKLVRYVHDGGKLLLFPEIPKMDLNGKICDLMSNEFGITVKDRVFPSVVFFGSKESFTEGSVSILESSGKYRQIATVDGRTCALSKKFGNGRIVVVGVPCAHYYDYSVDIIDDLATNELGVKRNVFVRPNDVVGMLRTGTMGSFLFLMNYHERDYTVDIKIDVPESSIKLKQDSISIGAKSAKILPVNAKISTSLTVKFSTAEIIGIKNNAKRLVLTCIALPSETVKIYIDFKGKNIVKTTKFVNRIEDVVIEL
ncbi:beta-galactosidase [Elusimicrobiota bacterium]